MMNDNPNFSRLLLWILLTKLITPIITYKNVNLLFGEGVKSFEGVAHS